MGSHINADGKFQSDKYPTCPAGKVPLSVEDPDAWDLLWQYSRRREKVDAEFGRDLRAALVAAGYNPNLPKRFRLQAVPGFRDRPIDGCYFPETDLVVYAGGQRGTGKPEGVTWIDE